ncbi:hypothetical protein SDJN02_09192 [Cucurbita argyrosperma subsp. argyrosperma]|nr:hypothetical protein SDJN02_09192 [Cucurbita argyrosperma subsp. argyrosperma]
MATQDQNLAEQDGGGSISQAMNTDEHSGTSKFPQISSHSPKSKSNSDSKGIASNMNSQYENLRPDVGMSPIVSLNVARAVAYQRPRISRSKSLTKIFSLKSKRAADSESSHGEGVVEHHISTRELAHGLMHRSNSVPDIREDGSVSLRRNTVRLTLTSPQIGKKFVMTPYKSPTYEKNIETSEHISEEPVCRICLIELGNGLETIKMECNCKGELALAHQECAIKWFSTKGNRKCDVCRQEVHNLPAALLQAHAIQAYNFQGSEIVSADITQYRVWQDVPFLVIINVLAYFGFLEQLLAGKMGSSALAFSLPFSCIFGLLASMAAATIVWKQYIWIYAMVQLAFVIAFSHAFYSKLHMQAILAILLATFSGFGVTMTLTLVLEKIFQRTRLWLDQSINQTPSAMQSNGSSATTHQVHADPPLGLRRGPEEPMQTRTLSAASCRSQIDPPDQDIEMGTSGALHQRQAISVCH